MMDASPHEARHPDVSEDGPNFYRSQVTLGLSSWRPILRFARLCALLVGVFQKTPGAVKLNFSVAPGRRQFTSHSVWQDSDAAQQFFKSPEHREAMKQAYGGMTDEFYVIHTGGKPFYNQRCPNCHVWTKGAAPAAHCSKCQTPLPHHLHPLAQKAEAPGLEYGIITPDMTPATNLKSLELAASLSGALSNERAAQVYRLLNSDSAALVADDDRCSQVARNPSIDNEPGPLSWLGPLLQCFPPESHYRGRDRRTIAPMRRGRVVFSRPMPDSWLAGRIIWRLISLSGYGCIALVWLRRGRRACPCS